MARCEEEYARSWRDGGEGFATAARVKMAMAGPWRDYLGGNKAGKGLKVEPTGLGELAGTRLTRTVPCPPLLWRLIPGYVD